MDTASSSVPGRAMLTELAQRMRNGSFTPPPPSSTTPINNQNTGNDSAYTHDSNAGVAPHDIAAQKCITCGTSLTDIAVFLGVFALTFSVLEPKLYDSVDSYADAVDSAFGSERRIIHRVFASALTTFIAAMTLTVLKRMFVAPSV